MRHSTPQQPSERKWHLCFVHTTRDNACQRASTRVDVRCRCNRTCWFLLQYSHYARRRASTHVHCTF